MTYEEYTNRFEINLEVSITVFTTDENDNEVEREHTFETTVECNELTGEYDENSRDEKIEEYIRKVYGEAQDWELNEVSEGDIEYSYAS